MTNYADFTIKGLRTFQGLEGQGFNASLYCKGKKVAFVIDSANGGDYEYQWVDYKEPSVTINTRTYDGKPNTYKGTPCEKILTEHSASLQPEDFEGTALLPNNDTILNNLVIKSLEDRDFKIKCKSKTLVITADCKNHSYIQFKHPYGAGIKAHIEKKYGKKLVEIINERYTKTTNEECIKII